MRFFIGFLAGVAAGYFLTSVLAQRTDASPPLEPATPAAP